jgi:hypothetical protein
MTSSTHPVCPICGSEIASNPVPLQSLVDVYACQCRRCGDFRYSPYALGSAHFSSVRHLVSAWIRRQIKAGIEHPFVPPDTRDAASIDNWFSSLQYAGFPRTVTEKLDALLQAYADIIEDEIGKVIKPHLYPHLVSEIAAKSGDEIGSLNRLLHQLNYIDFSGGTNLTIKADGWNRIDQMRRNVKLSDFAFIAMWFHPCTTEYRAATSRAVEYCGYKPVIVDESDFNGFIMDQVIALIRQSRFLIADFTCKPEVQEGDVVNQGVRGGVYWEAGLAFGMDKPVIHTCEDSEDSKRRIHFDVAQYRMLYWKCDELTTEIRDLTQPLPNPRFAERLAQHILATIGKGNYTQ